VIPSTFIPFNGRALQVLVALLLTFIDALLAGLPSGLWNILSIFVHAEVLELCIGGTGKVVLGLLDIADGIQPLISRRTSSSGFRILI